MARPCAKKGGDAPPAKGDGGVDEAAKGGAGAEDEGKWGGPKIYVGFLGDNCNRPYITELLKPFFECKHIFISTQQRGRALPPPPLLRFKSNLTP